MITDSYTAEEYASLPIEMALMLRAHVRDGKSYQDLVVDMATPLGTVKSRINRARGKIKRMRESAKQSEAA